MSTLFTIKDSWQSKPRLYENLAYAQSGDGILLIEDAVYSLQSKLSLASFLAKCQAGNIAVLALEDDANLRGVVSQYPAITQIDYSDFVERSLKHDRQVAW